MVIDEPRPRRRITSQEIQEGLGAEPVGKVVDGAIRIPMSELLYIARVTSRGRPIYTSAPYRSHEEAAIDAFTNVPTAQNCTSSRATIINGELSDRGGLDIRFHQRRNLMP